MDCAAVALEYAHLWRRLVGFLLTGVRFLGFGDSRELCAGKIGPLAILLHRHPKALPRRYPEITVLSKEWDPQLQLGILLGFRSVEDKDHPVRIGRGAKFVRPDTVLWIETNRQVSPSTL
jgi:hypothetical protein